MSATMTDVLQDVWDKTTDAFNAATEKISGGLVRLFGASNERTIRRIRPIVDRINGLEPQFQALSDDQLRAKTDEFRDRLEKGETLDDILPEAFAATRESGRRYLKMRHYDVQLLGGVILHQGNIAEMVTGEGKTLVATLPTYLNALLGKGVHVITVNDYLARRDAEWMSPIFQGLGMSVGAIQAQMDNTERQAMYQRDITYGTNNEFGFDYLRDNMKPEKSMQVQGPLHYAVIDEVDSILIDEARTPLIISGPAFDDVKKYAEADRISRQLRKGEHFEVKEKERTCNLTDDGVREAERLAGVESFYTPGNMEWPHLIDNSLKAHHLYQRDKDYMVKDGEVIIIDEFTGRLMIGRQWSDGLHQAVEAKERVKIKEETQTLATITLQNYFKLYKKLSGMTGTAMTEANEFYKVYKLDVVAIPTNKGLSRVNEPDVVYKSEREKFQAIIDEAKEIHKSGRPILVGTTSVAKSEELSEVLSLHGIEHQVLNAKYHEKEAEIVAQAGRKGRVTIATNMAGRGTDIILGGNPEFMAWADLKFLKDEDGRPVYPTRLEVPPTVWRDAVAKYEDEMKAEGREVAAAGGLHIIGTERHESRRIDNQLRGRCGRQGDPGSSRFFLALEDELMRKFIGDFARKIIEMSGLREGEAIESKMVTRRIEGAQKKIEERNFDVRKNLLEYDEVMDQQRKRVYSFRQRLLDGWPPKDDVLGMIDRQIRRAANLYLADDFGPSSFAEFVGNRLGAEFTAKDFLRLPFEEAVEAAREAGERQLADQISEAMEENLPDGDDRRDWNWIALVNWMQARYGVTVKVGDLKKFLATSREVAGEEEFDRTGLLESLKEKAVESLRKVDLSEGKAFLEPNYGRRSFAEWLRDKFGLELDAAKWGDAGSQAVIDESYKEALDLYAKKEAEFPVRAGLSRFIIEAQPNTGPRYDRDGLAAWAAARFGEQVDPDAFRSLMRQELEQALLAISQRHNEGSRLGRELDDLLEKAYGAADPKTKAYPPANPQGIDALVAWARKELGVESTAADLKEMTRDQTRNQLHSAIDSRYRPEMREMEKMLVLRVLDDSWMEHLRTMDHLRSSVGLRGYAQVDPKTEYKREGMRLFEAMWDSISDRVTAMVYRMESFDPDFLAYLAHKQMMSLKTVHAEATAGAALPAAGRGAPPQRAGDEGTAESSDANGETRAEPIRNLGKKVGRNDPCPCGSGKKYKNCCLRNQAHA